MAKFVIECPNCGRYAEAKTGFFARKKIDCACGYTIDVHTDKLAGRECPHCGNAVVYDQSKGNAAKCPVCGEPINSAAERGKMEDFSCAQCGVRLRVNKSAEKYTCPVCDCVNDVTERLMQEKIHNDGLASIIKYEGDNETFVWKHPIEDFNLGSQLIVHESQEAIFFRDGKALDLFAAGRYTLATQNIPLLENLYELPTNTTEVFHSEVYFVNLTTQMGIKWGTDSKVRLFDPASGLHIEIGACGNFSLRVCDSRRLLVRLVGTASGFKQNEVIGDTYSISSVVGKFKALVMNKVKSNLARIIKENNINILEVDEYIDVLSEKLRLAINEILSEYGLTMPEFFVTSILTPDDDPNFRRLKQQFADRTLKVREEEIRKAEAEAAQRRKILEAQTNAQLKLVGVQGEAEALKIKAQAEAEAYKAKAFAEAEEMRAKGYTYQQETARMVGMEAMKNGLTGAEGSAGGSILGGLGDIAGLGVTLGAMGGVMGMTKDAMEPLFSGAAQFGKQTLDAVTPTAPGAWDCPCGNRGVVGNFCNMCGSPRPVSGAMPGAWDCTCGQKAVVGNFCPNCGKKREG